jgi:Sensors of blue-light using FAD
MSSDKLAHLIYTSAATQVFDPADLKTILQTARSKNAQRSITGMLLYIAGNFFQVLEGEETALSELFAIISSDPRHKNVTKIIHEPIAQRAFGAWTMGYSEVAPSELEAIDGFNDFFREGNSLTDLRPGRAKKLISAFAQGRWRARLNGDAK